jgi:hypothetical protein
MKIFNKIALVVLITAFTLGFKTPGVTFAASPAAVNLGSAGNFVILTKSGISTTGASSITGDIGVSPIAASGMTGFGLIMDSSNKFATSSLVSGNIYASDYAPPTPAKMTTAVSDMETAYTDAVGRPADVTGLGAGNIGGMTIAPGVYKWSTGVTIPTDVTLSGDASGVWIFQIAQNLDISPAKRIILSGGAQAANVFWQVAGQATLGTTAIFNGNILDQTAVVLNTGATLNGRALAQTAVTLDANVVLTPSLSIPTPTSTTTVSTTTTTVSTITPTITATTVTSTTPTSTTIPLVTTTTPSVNSTIYPAITAPQFPNTGTAPVTQNMIWYIVIPASISAILLFFYFASKKKTV